MATVSEREKLEAEELEDRVVRIDRTRKTVKGGRISSARVVVAVGDNRGRLGLGVGKARNVPEAIAKGIRKAKDNMISIPMDGYTIPHVIQAKVGGAVILLKPASRGTGIIAGGAVRQLIEVSGIRDVLTKSLGSGNVMNRAKACFKALSMLRDPRMVAEQRGTTVEALIGRSIVNPYEPGAAPPPVEKTPIAPLGKITEAAPPAAQQELVIEVIDAEAEIEGEAEDEPGEEAEAEN